MSSPPCKVVPWEKGTVFLSSPNTAFSGTRSSFAGTYFGLLVKTGRTAIFVLLRTPFDAMITVRFRCGKTAENQAIPGVHILSPDQPFDYICSKHTVYTIKFIL